MIKIGEKERLTAILNDMQIQKKKVREHREKKIDVSEEKVRERLKMP